jgi:hypothetical protein
VGRLGIEPRTRGLKVSAMPVCNRSQRPAHAQIATSQLSAHGSEPRRTQSVATTLAPFLPAVRSTPPSTLGYRHATGTDSRQAAGSVPDDDSGEWVHCRCGSEVVPGSREGILDVLGLHVGIQVFL